MDLPVILKVQRKSNWNYHIQGGVTMTSITYIGMDVHTTNFTLCCYSFEDDKVYATVQVKPKYTQILKYMNAVRSVQMYAELK